MTDAPPNRPGGHFGRAKQIVWLAHWNAVSRRLTTEELRRMNGEVRDGSPIHDVVTDWLDRYLPEVAG